MTSTTAIKSPERGARHDPSAPLLAIDELPPYAVFNPDGTSPILLLCEHASNRMPRALGDMGLPLHERQRHIAWDIGAMALAQHLSLSLDAPLSDYLPDADATRGAITLRELLAQDPVGMPIGENTDHLAFVLERVTKQKYSQLLVDRLWRPLEGGPLEFRVADNRLRPGGVSAGCCVRARIGDWMRIGEMLAHDGVFQGNQFTPPRFVQLMMRPAHRGSPRGYFTRVDGGFAAQDVAWLEGHGKQRLWIVPSLRLTILRIGDDPPESAGWDEAMIPDSIIRGTSGWQPRQANDALDPRNFAPH